MKNCKITCFYKQMIHEYDEKRLIFVSFFNKIIFQLPKFKFITAHLVVSTAQMPIAAHLKKTLPIGNYN